MTSQKTWQTTDGRRCLTNSSGYPWQLVWPWWTHKCRKNIVQKHTSPVDTGHTLLSEYNINMTSINSHHPASIYYCEKFSQLNWYYSISISKIIICRKVLSGCDSDIWLYAYFTTEYPICRSSKLFDYKMQSSNEKIVSVDSRLRFTWTTLANYINLKQDV